MAVNVGDIIKFTGTDNEFNPYPQMDSRYGPYESLSESLTALTAPLRCIGLTVGIKLNNSITEYWFKDGVSDSNLVRKSDDTYQGYISKSGTKSREDFYSTLTEIVDTSAYVILSSNVTNVKVEVTLSNGEPVKIGSSSVESLDSTTNVVPSEELSCLYIDTKSLDTSLSEDARTINISTSNSEDTSTYVLQGDTISHHYSSDVDCTVTISLPVSTYEQAIGFYDSRTGQLLSNEQTYSFDTPSDTNISHVTIKFIE